MVAASQGAMSTVRLSDSRWRDVRSARSRDVPVSVAYRISAVLGEGGGVVMLGVGGECPLVVVGLETLYGGLISDEDGIRIRGTCSEYAVSRGIPREQ